MDQRVIVRSKSRSTAQQVGQGDSATAGLEAWLSGHVKPREDSFCSSAELRDANTHVIVEIDHFAVDELQVCCL